MRSVRKYLPLAGVLALTVGLAGCAAPGVEGQRTVATSEVDGDTLRGGGEYDYDIQSSMLRVVDTSDVAVTGRITSWTEGRRIQCGDALRKRVVVEIATDTILAGTGAPDSVFVEIWSGGVTVDAEGKEVPLEKGSSYVDRSAEEMEAAAPVGTRVIVAAGNAPSASEIEKHSCKIVDEGERPTGAEQLLAPVPQGFILEGADGNHVSGVAHQYDVEWGEWPRGENTFQQIVDELYGTKR